MPHAEDVQCTGVTRVGLHGGECLVVDLGGITHPFTRTDRERSATQRHGEHEMSIGAGTVGGHGTPRVGFRLPVVDGAQIGAAGSLGEVRALTCGAPQQVVTRRRRGQR